jgi:hypothetical protein
MDDSDDDSLAEIAEREPKTVLGALSVSINQDGGENLSSEELLEFAALVAKEEQLNVLRLMRDNPGDTEEIFDVDPTGLTDETLEKIDRLIE